MRNLARSLNNALLRRLPMWSKVEIETATDDTLVLVVSIPARDPESKTYVGWLVETFRFELTHSSAGVRHPGKLGLLPAEFADHWKQMEIMRKDLDEWWCEVAILLWAVRRDENGD